MPARWQVTRSGRESPIIAGYNSFPRFFIRRVFQAGLAIALRMEGRAKTGMLGGGATTRLDAVGWLALSVCASFSVFFGPAVGTSRGGARRLVCPPLLSTVCVDRCAS